MPDRGRRALLIQQAADERNLAIVRLLLEHGAHVHADDEAALRAAAEEGHVAVAEALIAAGADPHHKDRDGESAFQLAQQSGNRRLLRALERYRSRPASAG